MAYEKLNLTDGTVFTAAHVAHIEDGIDSAMAYRRQLTSDDDCNSLEDGAYWYSTSSVPANAPFANAAVLFVFGGGNRQIQLGFRYGQAGSGKFRAKQDGSWKLWAEFAGLLESADYPGCYYRFTGDVQEWVNPPLITGVEYRTIERHNNKPVYVRKIDLGTLPASGSKSTAYAKTGTGGTVFRWTAFAISSSGSYNPFPFVNSSGTFRAKLYFSEWSAIVQVFSDASDNTGEATVWYTKLTT